MKDRKRTNAGPNRRDFLKTVGAGAPSLTLLGMSAHVGAAPMPAIPADAAPVKEGGDPAYKHLTLDAVAQNHHEVNYEEIADVYGGPMSRGPLVSVKAHPEIVWARPDMGIGMVANPVAFGIGNTPVLIRWREVERSLLKGYLPIVRSHYQDGDLRYEQVLYATLLDGGEVKTGHEKQVAVIRMSVVNTSFTERRHAAWWAFAPAAIVTTDEPPYFWTYKLFDVTGSLPPASEQSPGAADGILRDGSTLLGVHEEGPGVTATPFAKATRFEMDLLPGQKKNVYLKVSTNKRGFTPGEIETLRRLDFVSAQDQREIVLEAVLNRGAKIHVPEEIVNNIYKAQILHNQTQMVQVADRDYYMPVQSSAGVWPWEQMKQLTGLDEFGYHGDVEKSLVYLLKLQGKRPPNAKVKSFAGVFPSSGTFEESGWERDFASTIYGLIAQRTEAKAGTFPNWVCNTGAALRTFAEHYFYTRDRHWLQKVAPAMVKACDWIIESRQTTMQHDAQGAKVLQYGLMPPGQPYDTPLTKGDKYFYCMTDGYTCQGFQRIAAALADAGHSEGPRLVREAASYRSDILEAMRRVRNNDPTLPPYPEELHGEAGWATFCSGALSLVDADLVDPEDPAFVQIENYMKQNFNCGVLGLSGRCHQDDKHNLGSYYVTITEDVYHHAWIVRGEVEKALLSFYSTLAFGVDKETLGAIERFMLYDRRYAPFYMDASGGMRICKMLRRTLLLERESELRLLPAAPRRWLEQGKTIQVADMPTYFGGIDLQVNSQVLQQKITVDLKLHVARPDRLKRVSLRVPHPTKQPIKRVILNGEPWTKFHPDSEMVQLEPSLRRHEIVVYY